MNLYPHDTVSPAQYARAEAMRMVTANPPPIEMDPKELIHSTAHWIYSGKEECTALQPANCMFKVK